MRWPAENSPVTIQPYQTISGYGVSDANLDIPTQSGLINVTFPGPTSPPLTTQNVVQFFNGEALGSTTLHSAYGFKQTGFPQSYKFPSPVPSPMATTIASNENWFTGLVATEDANGNECFSPEFKLTKGVYYFGDYNAYNSTNFRGIMIVGTPTPAPSRMLRAGSRMRMMTRPPQ